jgi:mRNA-degrading endonuclease toxin of MazEF toxin-antitoxin module
MTLQLYTSKVGAMGPNLVSLQHPGLAALPTMLVCPMRSGLALTPLRVEVIWGGESYVVACDLIRPISRKVLQALGELDEHTSQTIIKTFLRLLAGQDSGGMHK